jgi:hypothetical protein
VVAVLGLMIRVPPRSAVMAGLELWLAAGLLRLSLTDLSWTAIGSAALIIVLRRLVVAQLPSIRA